jgi:hypothetical protein
MTKIGEWIISCPRHFGNNLGYGEAERSVTDQKNTLSQKLSIIMIQIYAIVKRLCASENQHLAYWIEVFSLTCYHKKVGGSA